MSLNSGDLLKGNIFKLYIRFFIPALVSYVMLSVNYFVDAVCIGQKIGDVGLSAVAFAQPVNGFLISVGCLIGAGGSALYIISRSARDEKRAGGIYSTGFVTLLIISILFTIFGLIFIDRIIGFLGEGEASFFYTKQYLLGIIPFAFADLFEAFYSYYLDNDGLPELNMKMNVLAVAVNVVLDYFFIFVLEWGMFGAALATSLGVTTGLAGKFIVAFSKYSNLKLDLKNIGIGYLYPTVRNGFSVFMVYITVSIVGLAFNRVLLQISGELAVAVYSITLNINSIAISMITGAAAAMQPIVSANTGIGNRIRVNETLKVAMCTAVAITAVMLLACELMPLPIIKMFIEPSAAFEEMAVPAIRIIALSLIPTAINMMMITYFQAIAADTEAFIYSLIRGVALPVIAVFGCGMFYGLEGVWYSVSVSECCSFIVGVLCMKTAQEKLRDINYSRLDYFGNDKNGITIGEILESIGAEELSRYIDTMEELNKRDFDYEGIPAFIGLEDLGAEYDASYKCAKDDEGNGLKLAIATLLYTNLYEHDEKFKEYKNTDKEYPAVTIAASAVAARFFKLDGTNEA